MASSTYEAAVISARADASTGRVTHTIELPPGARGLLETADGFEFALKARRKSSDAGKYHRAPKKDGSEVSGALERGAAPPAESPGPLLTRASKAKAARAGLKEDCPICIEVMDDPEAMARTICGHYFHAECHRSWLKARDNAGELHVCPLCNRILGP